MEDTDVVALSLFAIVRCRYCDEDLGAAGTSVELKVLTHSINTCTRIPGDRRAAAKAVLHYRTLYLELLATVQSQNHLQSILDGTSTPSQLKGILDA